ncbi:MAG: hypothetical protein AAFO89_01775, partial [Planctomycetota bacterium]
MKFAVTALAIAAGSTVSAQTLVAVAANPADNNFASEVISVDLPYDGNAMLGPAFGTATWAAGDMFGRTSRLAAGDTQFGLPFAIADDSLIGFTGDLQGIIDENDNGDFFGLVDTQNNLNVSGGSAEYTWADTGAGTFVDSISIDMAA